MPEIYGDHSWNELSLANDLLLPIGLPGTQQQIGNTIPEEFNNLATTVAKNTSNGDLARLCAFARTISEYEPSLFLRNNGFPIKNSVTKPKQHSQKHYRATSVPRHP